MRGKFWAAFVPMLFMISDLLVKRTFWFNRVYLDFGMLRFVPTANTGVAFGFLSSLPGWVVFAINLVVCIIFWAIFLKERRIQYTIVWGIICSGATGNFIDRLMYGYVIDYIKLSFFSPVFNLADVMITIGAIGVVLLEIWQILIEKKGKICDF